MNNKHSCLTKVLMKYEPPFIATERLLPQTPDNISSKACGALAPFTVTLTLMHSCIYTVHIDIQVSNFSDSCNISDLALKCIYKYLKNKQTWMPHTVCHLR